MNDKPPSVKSASFPAQTKSVPAVRRAAAILWLLAERRGPLNLSQIARATAMLPSTALHILRELTAAQLIETNGQSRQYRLGNGILRLAAAVDRNDLFEKLAAPRLQDIANRFGVTATATALIDDTHTACKISISPPSDMSLNVTLGGRVPRLAGAAGRCIAAHSKDTAEHLYTEFMRIRWHSPLSFEHWQDELRMVRANGFSQDDGVFSPGILTMASAVLDDHGGIHGIVGMASISATLNEAHKSEIAQALIVAAREVGAAMNASPVQ